MDSRTTLGGRRARSHPPAPPSLGLGCRFLFLLLSPSLLVTGTFQCSNTVLGVWRANQRCSGAQGRLASGRSLPSRGRSPVLLQPRPSTLAVGVSQAGTDQALSPLRLTCQKYFCNWNAIWKMSYKQSILENILTSLIKV